METSGEKIGHSEHQLCHKIVIGVVKEKQMYEAIFSIYCHLVISPILI